MSNTATPWTTDRDDETAAASDSTSEADLAARLELLMEENRRLRDDIRRARQSRYRRTALAMAGLGAVVGGLGVLFPSSQAVFFALAGTGLFGAILIYFLTPEQFVSATVGERMYAAHAELGAELIDSLGLSETIIYLPTGNTAGADAGVRIFVPHHRNHDLPSPDDAATLFVATANERHRGVAVPPTGAGLFREFESMVDDPADDLPELADRLADALVEGFELVGSATPDVDKTNGRVSIGVSDSRYGAVDRFDHPVASFIAVGVVRWAERPVTLESTTGKDERVDYLVSCSLESEE
ncbi:hypothetical protein [Halocatena pleomorpha]|uniref:DUF7982 domain-containing protein n=1 Tax=Halocatena pleomorpha TaxID=1785090 RepID=A0A3P3R8U0_9EURY|nr:hypothetical protein [Halocatena pleomorpha]RRJ29458.1 hypothetical protein EIK79_12520 [Halocatena pleomorpha]